MKKEEYQAPAVEEMDSTLVAQIVLGDEIDSGLEKNDTTGVLP